MAHRDAAGFFAVVSEISLRVKVGVVADNFNRGLVRAYSAVRAETPELASGRAFGREVHVMISGSQRFVRHVVIDTDCETVERRIFFEFVEDRKHLVGRCVFAAETETSADDNGFDVRVVEGRFNVRVQRLTD